MSLKFPKPDTPSKRGLVQIDRSGLHKGGPYKPLCFGLRKKAGRNNHGRVTVRYQGGGHKRLYREIDFHRKKRGILAEVVRIEFDPNRSSFIALIRYEDGEINYVLAPHGLKPGDKVIADESADIRIGNASPLKNIPVGTVVHNVELKVGRGGQLARSAGASAEIVGRSGEFSQIKLSSGEIRLVHSTCYGTIGSLSNPDRKNVQIGKAGRNRWLNKRPAVRGVAKNPVDHPHGGGEGKTSGGRHPVTPWGKSTKGKKTRKNKRTDKFILSRRKK